MDKKTLKINHKVYQRLVEIKTRCTECKYNSDTVNMLIDFYLYKKGK